MITLKAMFLFAVMSLVLPALIWAAVLDLGARMVELAQRRRR